MTSMEHEEGTVLVTASKYALDNAMDHARERLSRLQDVYDPGTIRLLGALGVDSGWRCLEVGAGAGSIAVWMSEQVGPSGSVLATDIDPRFLDQLAAERANIEVRQHDVVNDELPVSAFDLIHTRMVLEHLPARDQALSRLVNALTPGGWLMIESIDFGSEAPDPSTLR